MKDSSEISPSLSGEMTIGTAKHDIASIKSLIQNNKNFDLDFSKIQKIDLSGIQIIIAAQKTIDSATDNSGKVQINTYITESMKRCGYEHSADFEISED